MCCRYFIDDESEQFRTIIEEMSRSPLLGKWKPAAAIKTSGEIRPTDIAPVIAPNKAGSRTVFPMQWGVHRSLTSFKRAVGDCGGKAGFQGRLEAAPLYCPGNVLLRVGT